MKFRRSLACLSAVCFMSIPAFSQNESLETLVEKSRAAMKESRWQQALDFNSQAVSRFGKNDPLQTYGAQFGAVYYRKGL